MNAPEKLPAAPRCVCGHREWEHFDHHDDRDGCGVRGCDCQSFAAPRPEARTGEASDTRWNFYAAETHLAECPDCGFTFDSMHEDVGGGYSCPLCAQRRLATRLAAIERERDEARRAREVADHDLRCIIAALSPSELVRLSRLLAEDVAALAARPAETPEGR